MAGAGASHAASCPGEEQQTQQAPQQPEEAESESEAGSEVAHALMGVARDAPLDHASEHASLLATAHRCARTRDERAVRFQHWVIGLAFRRRCPQCDYFERSLEGMAVEVFARISDRKWFDKALASIGATTTRAIIARAIAGSQADAPAQPGEPATPPSAEAARATADSGDGPPAEADLGQMMLDEVDLYRDACDSVQAMFECLDAQARCTPLTLYFHQWRRINPAPLQAPILTHSVWCRAGVHQHRGA